MKRILVTIMVLLWVAGRLQADLVRPVHSDRKIDTSLPGILQLVEIVNLGDFPEIQFFIILESERKTPFSKLDKSATGKPTGIGNQGEGYRIFAKMKNEEYLSVEIPGKLEFGDPAEVVFRLHKLRILSLQDGIVKLREEDNYLIDIEGHPVNNSFKGSISGLGLVQQLILPAACLLALVAVLIFGRRQSNN
jgi:hypothetical protein